MIGASWSTGTTTVGRRGSAAPQVLPSCLRGRSPRRGL